MSNHIAQRKERPTFAEMQAAIGFAIGALDRALGDSDPVHLSDEELVEEYPLIVAMQRLVAVHVAAEDAAPAASSTKD